MSTWSAEGGGILGRAQNNGRWSAFALNNEGDPQITVCASSALGDEDALFRFISPSPSFAESFRVGSRGGMEQPRPSNHRPSRLVLSVPLPGAPVPALDEVDRTGPIVRGARAGGEGVGAAERPGNEPEEEEEGAEEGHGDMHRWV